MNPTQEELDMIHEDYATLTRWINAAVDAAGTTADNALARSWWFDKDSDDRRDYASKEIAEAANEYAEAVNRAAEAFAAQVASYISSAPSELRQRILDQQ